MKKTIRTDAKKVQNEKKVISNEKKSSIITRRDFIKTAAITGAVTAVALISGSNRPGPPTP